MQSLDDALFDLDEGLINGVEAGSEVTDGAEAFDRVDDGRCGSSLGFKGNGQGVSHALSVGSYRPTFNALLRSGSWRFTESEGECLTVGSGTFNIGVEAVKGLHPRTASTADSTGSTTKQNGPSSATPPLARA